MKTHLISLTVVAVVLAALAPPVICGYLEDNDIVEFAKKFGSGAKPPPPPNNWRGILPESKQYDSFTDWNDTGLTGAQKNRRQLDRVKRMILNGITGHFDRSDAVDLGIKCMEYHRESGGINEEQGRRWQKCMWEATNELGLAWCFARHFDVSMRFFQAVVFNYAKEGVDVSFDPNREIRELLKVVNGEVLAKAFPKIPIPSISGIAESLSALFKVQWPGLSWLTNPSSPDSDSECSWWQRLVSGCEPMHLPPPPEDPNCDDVSQDYCTIIRVYRQPPDRNICQMRTEQEYHQILDVCGVIREFKPYDPKKVTDEPPTFTESPDLEHDKPPPMSPCIERVEELEDPGTNVVRFVRTINGGPRPDPFVPGSGTIVYIEPSNNTLTMYTDGRHVDDPNDSAGFPIAPTDRIMLINWDSPFLRTASPPDKLIYVLKFTGFKPEPKPRCTV